MKIKLQFKVTMIVFACFLPLLALIGYSSFNYRQLVIERIMLEQQVLAQQFSSYQSELLSNVKTLLGGYASNPIFFDGNPDNDSAVLRNSMQVIPSIANIAITDANGMMYSSAISASGEVDYSDRQWYQKVITDKKFTIGEFVTGKTTGIPVFPVAYPILNSDNKIVSIFSTGIDTKWIYDRVKLLNLPEQATLTIIDMHGNILAKYPNPEQYTGVSMPDSELVQGILGTPNGSIVSTGFDGVERYYRMSPLEDVDVPYGIIAIGFPTKLVTERTRTATILNIVLLALGYLITLSILLLSLRKKVVKPSKEMLAAFGKLANGNSAFRLPSLPGEDEMSELVTSFNNMATELQAHREKLNTMVMERTIELENTTKELMRSNHELEQFAYVASHDLQEPLRMVASFTQLLENRYKDKLDDKAHQYIQFAVDGARRMQALINDLLLYSRVGTQSRPYEYIDLHKTLEDVLNNLSAVIDTTNATVQIGEMPVIFAEQLQMEQVFQNLISNAIKFHGDSKPIVEVTAREEEHQWIFQVKDNGIGIDPQFFDRIFIVFQRLHERDAFSGTGIGLAIVKKIIERHNGKIWIESKLGQGSLFVFTIPKVKEK